MSLYSLLNLDTVEPAARSQTDQLMVATKPAQSTAASRQTGARGSYSQLGLKGFIMVPFAPVSQAQGQAFPGQGCGVA